MPTHVGCLVGLEPGILNTLGILNHTGRPLTDDVQLDSNTALIGWDFSTGDPGDHPHVGLARVELADYLRVRGASDAYHRLGG